MRLGRNRGAAVNADVPSLALILLHHGMEVDTCAFGLRHIHAAVRRAGFPVWSVYVGFDPESEAGLEDFSRRVLPELIQTLERLRPNVVGFSVFSSYVPAVRQAIRLVRQRLPETILIAGGPDVTMCPERMANNADFVFRGECEDAVPIFLGNLAGGRPPGDCPNVWFMRQDAAAATVNPLLPLRQDLDALARPDYAADGSHIYLNSPLRQSVGRMTWYSMMTSRGCPYRCEFCVNPVHRRLFAGLGNFLRRRSVASVIDELEGLKRANPRLEKICFYDEVFTTDRRWVAEFAESYAGIGLPFFCQTDPRVFNRGVLPVLARAGLRWLSTGLQGSPRVARQYYDRQYRAEDIIEVGRLGKELGFETIFDLIVDEPFSRDEDRREVLEILLQIPRPYRLNTYSMLYFPGYAATGRALRAGIIENSRVEGEGNGRFEWNRFLKKDKDPRILRWECLYDLAANTEFPADEIRRLAGRVESQQEFLSLLGPCIEKRSLARSRLERAVRMEEHVNAI
jgi:radical SAM superfamily enzyme YgiQ (UPF0313 family)